VRVRLVDTVVAEDGETLLEAYERCRSVYSSMSCCDYSLRVAVTCWSDQVKQDMQRLVTDKGTATHTRPSGVPATLITQQSG